MKAYCQICDDERETTIIQKLEKYTVKGTEITVCAQVRICEECNNEVWDADLDDENLRKAYNKYRDQKGLLHSEVIKAIRLKYKVSQTLFAKILGLGEKTITRYENGSLQDEAQNNLILLSSIPNNFKMLLERSREKLTLDEQESIDFDSFSLPTYRLSTASSVYHYASNNWTHVSNDQNRIA